MDAACDPEFLKATARGVADFKNALEEFLENRAAALAVGGWGARGASP
jgi:hypothetical protein